jgi:E3 ubiquitin-protein ligase ZSWIM2
VRVIIGNPHSCNCKATKICLHILFILLKVLRVPESNFLCKKVALSDSEINIILSGDFGERKPRTVARRERKVKVRKTNEAGESETEDVVERQPMDDENPDICPICQDDMTKNQALTWCRKGCGNNIHA